MFTYFIIHLCIYSFNGRPMDRQLVESDQWMEHQWMGDHWMGDQWVGDQWMGDQWMRA